MSIFAGFMSLCMTPAEWMKLTEQRRLYIIILICSSYKSPGLISFIICFISFGLYSITKNNPRLFSILSFGFFASIISNNLVTQKFYCDSLNWRKIDISLIKFLSAKVLLKSHLINLIAYSFLVSLFLACTTCPNVPSPRIVVSL